MRRRGTGYVRPDVTSTVVSRGSRKMAGATAHKVAIVFSVSTVMRLPVLPLRELRVCWNCSPACHFCPDHESPRPALLQFSHTNPALCACVLKFPMPPQLIWCCFFRRIAPVSKLFSQRQHTELHQLRKAFAAQLNAAQTKESMSADEQ